MDHGALREAAIEDNIAWCAAVSAAHGAEEVRSVEAWANLADAPRYYPNVISRRPGAQAAVTALLRQLQGPKPRSVKDSFHDLDVHPHGFTPVIEAQWFGGDPSATGVTVHPWERVRAPEDSLHWAQAWDAGASPFKATLLSDPRISFWQLRRNDEIQAGGISFASGAVVGLSNWFASGNETAFALGWMAAIAKAFPGLPAVLWSEDDQGFTAHGFMPLGRLRVWVTS